MPQTIRTFLTGISNQCFCRGIWLLRNCIFWIKLWKNWKKISCWTHYCQRKWLVWVLSFVSLQIILQVFESCICQIKPAGPNIFHTEKESEPKGDLSRIGERLHLVQTKCDTNMETIPQLPERWYHPSYPLVNQKVWCFPIYHEPKLCFCKESKSKMLVLQMWSKFAFVLQVVCFE